MPAFDQPRRRPGVEVGAERDHEDVRVEVAGVGAHPARVRVDRFNDGVDEAHARLVQVPVRMPDRRFVGAAEHHVQLREPEDEALGPVDEGEIEGVAELVGQPGRQLQTPETGAQHDDVHGGRLLRRAGPGGGAKAPRPGTVVRRTPGIRAEPVPAERREIDPVAAEPHALGEQPLALLGVEVLGQRAVRAQHPVPRHRAVVQRQHPADDRAERAPTYSATSP